MPEAKMDDTLVSLRQLIDDNDRRINDLLAEKEHRINGLMRECDLRFQQRFERPQPRHGLQHKSPRKR
jgi:hypothetical protein